LITRERWYDADPDLSVWYQGDVVADIPYPFFPPLEPANREQTWPLLRPLSAKNRDTREAMRTLPTHLVGRAARDVPDRWTMPEGEYVVAGCRKINIMMVTRSCTLDNPKRKHFLVAPVVSVDDLAVEQQGEAKLRELRSNKIPQAFYLPAKDGLRESYADLLRLVPIHRTFFPAENIGGVLLARLSSVGTDSLQQALSAHFGTKFGFDHQNIVPQKGQYSCSNCFYSGMKLQTKMFEAGRPFGVCPACDEDATWVKLP
jgi:hypothetical protein